MPPSLQYDERMSRVGTQDAYGTLASILKRIAAHHGMSVDDLLKMLDP